MYLIYFLTTTRPQFGDDLIYKEEAWDYCDGKTDRRFHSEIQENKLNRASGGVYRNTPTAKPLKVSEEENDVENAVIFAIIFCCVLTRLENLLFFTGRVLRRRRWLL